MAQPIQHNFDPYTQTGGTTVAITGKDFAILGSDTRLSEGYLISARNAPKTFKLTDSAVLSFCGFHADGITLVNAIKQRIKWYKFNHSKVMSIKSLAQLIQTILYGRRFFPYYTNVTLAGLSTEGTGVVYNFDPVGNYEAVLVDSIGTGSSLLQPLLDNQVGRYHQKELEPFTPELELAKQLILDGFTSATERDIYTGDFLQLFIIDSNGVTEELLNLKRD